MPSIHSIINKTIKSDRPAEILTVFYDGVFDFTLAETGHNFYGVMGQSSVNWTNLLSERPPNIFLLNEYDINRYDFDLLIINNREKNLELISQYQMLFQLPIIAVDHLAPNVNIGRNKFILNKATPRGITTVAIDEEIQKKCGSHLCIKDELGWNNIINTCRNNIWIK